MRRILILIVTLAVVAATGLFLLWPRGSRGLVLYSAVDYGPAVAAAFTQETGIPVAVVDLSTGALLAKVSAEGRRPAWSLLWFDGDLAAAALDHAGLLARHVTPKLPWTTIGRTLVPADGAYIPTGLTLAGVFTYRQGTSVPVPQWTALLDPAYRGAIGMNNPAISGPMYPLLAGMLEQAGGWPKGQAYVMALRNNGLHVYHKNANTLAALRQGQIKVAVTQSSAAFYVSAQDPSLRVVIPRPAFALPSVLALAPGLTAEQDSAARRFVRFVMSAQIQRLRMAKGAGDANYWPLTTDVPPPPNLPALSSVSLTRLDPAKWSLLEQTINAWFSKAVVGQ